MERSGCHASWATPVRCVRWCLMALLSTAALWARAPDELDPLLLEPVSPGAIALLVEHTEDPRAIERLSEALLDPRAPVRAAAARVLLASGSKALADELEHALKLETSRDAARELSRAVLTLGGADRVELALDAAERLEIASVVAMQLAAVERERALRHLARLRSIPSFDVLTSFLNLCSRASFESLALFAPRALRDVDVEMWRAYLLVARERSERVDEGLLTFSVGATEPAIRIETLAFLVFGLSQSRPLPSVVEAAVVERIAARAASLIESVEESFLLELIARQRGAPPVENVEWMRRRREHRPTPLLSSNRVLLEWMTRDERRAWSSYLLGDEEGLDEWLASRDRARTPLAAATPLARAASRTTPLWSTVGGYPAELVADVLRVTSCVFRDRPPAQAEANFSVDGRPIRIALPAVPGTASDGCDQAVRALFSNYVIAPGDLEASANWEILFLLFSDDFLECSSAATGAYSREWRDIRASGVPARLPKVRRPIGGNVGIVEGIGAGSWAFVMTSMTIEATGCPTNMRIVDGLDPDRDLEVLDALAALRFQPLVWKESPVPFKVRVPFWFQGR